MASLADIYTYRGGTVPGNLRQRIIHAVIHPSITKIEEEAFEGCDSMKSVECHSNVTKIEDWAFFDCSSLKSIKLQGVKYIGKGTFKKCWKLTTVEFGEELDVIKPGAFDNCTSLTRIVLPPKGCLFMRPTHERFANCPNLRNIEVSGNILSTIYSLNDEESTKMVKEIGKINLILRNNDSGFKTSIINQWMSSVLSKLEKCKTAHNESVEKYVKFLIIDAESYPEERELTHSVMIARQKRIEACFEFVLENVLSYLQIH